MKVNCMTTRVSVLPNLYLVLSVTSSGWGGRRVGLGGRGGVGKGLKEEQKLNNNEIYCMANSLTVF